MNFPRIKTIFKIVLTKTKCQKIGTNDIETTPSHGRARIDNIARKSVRQLQVSTDSSAKYVFDRFVPVEIIKVIIYYPNLESRRVASA